MAARRPFWKRHRWKSIGFCLWPPSTCIWSLKLKFQSKLDLCSGNHVVYRQTDGQTDKVNPVYPPSNFVGRGYKNVIMKFLIVIKNTKHLHTMIKTRVGLIQLWNWNCGSIPIPILELELKLKLVELKMELELKILELELKTRNELYCISIVTITLTSYPTITKF